MIQMTIIPLSANRTAPARLVARREIGYAASTSRRITGPSITVVVFL